MKAPRRAAGNRRDLLKRPDHPVRGALAALLLAVLALGFLTSCGAKKKSVTVVVRDREGNYVPGIKILEAGGGEKPLGVTGGDGRVEITLAGHKGGPLRLRLISPSGDDGPLYRFVAPVDGIWEITDLGLEPDFKMFLVDRAGAEATGESAQEGADSLGTAPTASLRVLSTPPGAQIRIDGQDRGTTPTTLSSLPAGRVRLELALKGYRTHTRDLILLPGDRLDTVDVTLTAESSARGETSRRPSPPSLRVESTPEGARIEIDDHIVDGETPKTVTGLSPGFHLVRVLKDQYQTYETTVELEQGKRARVNAVLASLSSPVNRTERPTESTTAKQQYSVSTKPGWAEVYVDDRPDNYNITGQFQISLTPGRHSFRVVNPGAGVDIRLSYTVRSGDSAGSLILDWEARKVVAAP